LLGLQGFELRRFAACDFFVLFAQNAQVLSCGQRCQRFGTYGSQRQFFDPRLGCSDPSRCITVGDTQEVIKQVRRRSEM
jgi:hypothetical protein